MSEALDEKRSVNSRLSPTADPRLPAPGTHLVRRFRGNNIIVHVRESGFECDGKVHTSLSAAVRAATAKRWNGFAFFGLCDKPGRKRGANE